MANTTQKDDFYWDDPFYIRKWKIRGLSDPDLEPAPAVTPSEIGFRLTILEDGAKAISGNPYEKVYLEIEALRKAELEAGQQSQEQVDGLAESTPVDLADYPQREV